jgi:hypothetical protein
MLPNSSESHFGFFFAKDVRHAASAFIVGLAGLVNLN